MAVTAQLLGLEDVKYRDDQPFARPRLEGLGGHGEILPPRSRGWLDQTYARISAAEWPAYLTLEFVGCLNRVPPRCPKEREQRGGSRSQPGLHGERKSRVRIV